MAEYVSRCILSVDGTSIEDFKKVGIEDVELHKEVPLMNKTGFVKVTPRRKVTVDYVVPENATPFDWSKVKDGTLSIEFEDGSAQVFSGVYPLKIGKMEIDGDKETVRTIELGATDVVE